LLVVNLVGLVGFFVYWFGFLVCWFSLLFFFLFCLVGWLFGLGELFGWLVG